MSDDEHGRLDALIDALQLPEQAVGARQELLAAFGDATEPTVRTRVASALVANAHQLVSTKRYRAGTDAADEVISRYADDAGADIRASVARAYVYRGYALMRRFRFRAGWKDMQALVDHIGPNPEPEVRDAVLTSAGRGNRILRRARRYHTHEQPDVG